MKAFEQLDSDDQERAEAAAEVLRTMATILDNMRHLRALTGAPTAPTNIMDGQEPPALTADELASWRDWYEIQSGGAPVEDWLDGDYAPAEPKLCSACHCPLIDVLIEGDTERCEHCSDTDANTFRQWAARLARYERAECGYTMPKVAAWPADALQRLAADVLGQER